MSAAGRASSAAARRWWGPWTTCSGRLTRTSRWWRSGGRCTSSPGGSSDTGSASTGPPSGRSNKNIKNIYISPATERTVSIYLICILGDRNGKNVSNLYNEWTFHGGDEFSHHRHGERRIRWGQGFIYFIFLWLDIFIKRPFVTMPPLWILLWVAAVVAVKCIFLIGLIVSHGVKICRGGLQSPSLIAPDKMETILLWKWKVSIRCLLNLDDFINQPCHDSLWLFRYNVQ